MWIHEYQAKALLQRFAVPVPAGSLAGSPAEAARGARLLGAGPWVVKAQIHAGGRGKAGGIRPAATVAEVEAAAGALLGQRLVTGQTGPAGAPVDQVWVEPACVVERELYLACVLDRSAARIRLMVSGQGGMEIEESDARMHHVLFDPLHGLHAYECRRLAYGLDLPEAARGQLARIMEQVARLFLALDLSLVEINPLVLRHDGTLLALDAKIQADDNSLYRHPEFAALRDERQEDPREARARHCGLNFVALDGDIACMVNGAGLAMATMDLIKLHGGQPANFLDVGGGTTSDRVSQAFELITHAEGVKAVLVNIFGGIVRCDLIAEGILDAVRASRTALPVVVRLEGTNAARGRQLLGESGLQIMPAHSLDEAAALAVSLARGVRGPG